MAFGIPTIVLLIIFYVTGEKHPLFERIVSISVSLSMIVLCLSIVILTSQLKSIVLKKFQQNQVIPFTGAVLRSIPIR